MAEFCIALNSWTDRDLFGVVRSPRQLQFTNRCNVDLTEYEVALISCYSLPSLPAAPKTAATQTAAGAGSAKPTATASKNVAATAGSKPVAAQTQVQGQAQLPIGGASSQPPPKAPGAAAARSKRAAAPLAAGATVPSKVMLIECSAVRYMQNGTSAVQLLRVVDELGEYQACYMPCFDGKHTSITVTVRSPSDNTHLSRPPEELIMTLHFRRRQIDVGA
jgi:hypothetical protein